MALHKRVDGGNFKPMSVSNTITDSAPGELNADLTARICAALVEELMLEQSADQIDPQAPLFGPDGLGLDSVDALQLAVALEKRFGLKLADTEAARQVMRSVATIADAIEKCPVTPETAAANDA